MKHKRYSQLKVGKYFIITGNVLYQKIPSGVRMVHAEDEALFRMAAREIAEADVTVTELTWEEWEEWNK